MKLANKCYMEFLDRIQDKLNTDKEYLEAEEKRQQAFTKIKNILMPKQVKLLIQYDDCTINVDSLVAREHYINGFNYGRKLR